MIDPYATLLYVYGYKFKTHQNTFNLMRMLRCHHHLSFDLKFSLEKSKVPGIGDSPSEVAFMARCMGFMEGDLPIQIFAYAGWNQSGKGC